jgi:uncharacterized protein
MAGWRGLGRFWLAVLLLLTATAITLQVLGPPRPAGQALAPAPSPPPAPQASAAPAPAPARAVPAARPGRDSPGPIADPDPALMEPVTGQRNEFLPRIAADERMPMQVYAAGFDRTSRRPRVGLILAGVGLHQDESIAAIKALPAGVTLAFSPYATNPARLLAEARLAEHEYLVSVPMEPQGFPLNDPGPQALMTNLAPEQNRVRLEWALSRFTGYVGATGALGAMRGERFAGLAEQMNPVLTELAQRGLLYVDPRPNGEALPLVWQRDVDLVVDEPPSAAQIDQRLGELAKRARERGAALGLAGTVRPVTTERIAKWADGLMNDGVVLAPVSALAEPPRGAK